MSVSFLQIKVPSTLIVLPLTSILPPHHTFPFNSVSNTVESTESTLVRVNK